MDIRSTVKPTVIMPLAGRGTPSPSPKPAGHTLSVSSLLRRTAGPSATHVSTNDVPTNVCKDGEGKSSSTAIKSSASHVVQFQNVKGAVRLVLKKSNVASGKLIKANTTSPAQVGGGKEADLVVKSNTGSTRNLSFSEFDGIRISNVSSLQKPYLTPPPPDHIYGVGSKRYIKPKRPKRRRESRPSVVYYVGEDEIDDKIKAAIQADCRKDQCPPTPRQDFVRILDDEMDEHLKSVIVDSCSNFTTGKTPVMIINGYNKNTPKADQVGNVKDASSPAVSKASKNPIVEVITIDEDRGMQYNALNGEIVNTKTDAKPKSILECTECGLKFRSVEKYKKHEHEGLDLRRSHCLVCDEVIDVGDELAHFNLYHKNMELETGPCKESFKCQFCKCDLASRNQWLIHTRLHFETTKEYSCLVCNSTHDSIDSYVEHLRTHSIKKDHRCGKCSSSFALALACHRHEARCSNLAIKKDLDAGVDLEMTVVDSDDDSSDVSDSMDHGPKSTPSSREMSDRRGPERHTTNSEHSYSKPVLLIKKTDILGSKSAKQKKKDNIPVCEFCNKKYYVSLEAHLRSSHGKDSYTVVCNKCGGKFATQTSLEYHERSAHEKPCQICNLRCYLEKWKTFEGPTVAEYPCGRCERVFKTMTSRCYHTLKVHKPPEPSLCAECGATFALPSALRRHRLGVHRPKIPCPHCSKPFNKYELRFHIDRMHSAEKPMAQCQICGQQFSSTTSLRRHQKTKHEARRFSCSFCEYTATTRQLVKLHECAKHLDDTQKPYPCPYCDKRFVTIGTIGIHKTQCKFRPNKTPYKYNKIKGAKKKSIYKCPSCPLTFTLRVNLDNHMTIHGAKDYDVCYCGRKFLCKSALQRHTAIFHSGETLYNCTICPEKFQTKFDLHLHVQEHKGLAVVCEQCGKRFPNKSSLKRHKIRHHGLGTKNNHVCTVCDKTFPNKTCLERHALRHEGQTPFKCEVCERSFAELKNLKSHSCLEKACNLDHIFSN